MHEPQGCLPRDDLLAREGRCHRRVEQEDPMTIQHADAPLRRSIRYHVAQVVSCQRAGCAHCIPHEASEAYLMDVQAEAVRRQNEKRAIKGEAEW
jgi:hypothetical protein